MRLIVSTEAKREEAILKFARIRRLIMLSEWIQEPETTNLCQFLLKIENNIIIKYAGDEICPEGISELKESPLFQEVSNG